MTHPLTGDLKSVSDKDLLEKLNDLTKKYWMTNNPAVQNQIEMLLEDIKWEISYRRRKNKDNDIDNLIKVV
tara:strand:+ start:3396 stop:3608 length:213 start_codon:yes stop_codon:yes gene_type:complete